MLKYAKYKQSNNRLKILIPIPKIALIKMVITQAKLIMILNIIPKNCLFDLFPCYNHLMGRKSGL
jgi:hypothetical protein